MNMAKYIASTGIIAVVIYFIMICDTRHCIGHVKKGIDHKSISMTALTGKANVIPIAVIGSGPAGLSAAMYAGRSKHQTIVFEGHKPGGLLMDTTWVDNWPALPHFMGPDIIDKLHTQVESTGAIFLPYTITKVDFSVWPYTLTTEEGLVFHALSLVIATGATPRTLGIPGEKEYWGHGVTACAVCDAPFFRDEQVVVIGGGDSAVEQAIQLAPYAKKITVLIRKNRMRAAQSMQDRLKNYDHISLRYHVDVLEICGDNDEVTGVKVFNNKTDSEELIPVTGVFLAIGHDPNSGLFKDLLECEVGGYIRTMSKSQETSVPGVFAAGEVEDNHYRQASVASGNGVKAALDAIEFLSTIGYDLKMADKLKSQIVRKGDFDDTVVYDVPVLTSYAQFETLTKKNPDTLIVIDFFADYCSSCMAMLPIFASVAQEFKDQALFYKVDVGQHMELAKEEPFLVGKVPCLLVFKNGKLVARFMSEMNRQELTDFVEKYLDGVSA
jgi:thioredoxin reductase (NADPH)